MTLKDEIETMNMKLDAIEKELERIRFGLNYQLTGRCIKAITEYNKQNGDK